MVKILFMDVDGTLTDGKIYMGTNGELMKAFDIKDGYGIVKILHNYDIVPVIITGRASEIVINRCKELGINRLYQSVSDKLSLMKKVSSEFGLHENKCGLIEGIAYIGDDIPDYDCMMTAEIKGCPADAVQEIKDIADFVSAKKGGEGAVREFIEYIVKGDEEICEK